MLKARPKINMYDGEVNLYFEDEKGDLKAMFGVTIRGIFEGLKKGECSAYEEFIKDIMDAADKKDAVKGALLREAFRRALCKASADSLEMQIKARDIEISKEDMDAARALIERVMDDTFFVCLLRELGEREKAKKEGNESEPQPTEETPQKSGSEGENKIEIKFV